MNFLSMKFSLLFWEKYIEQTGPMVDTRFIYVCLLARYIWNTIPGSANFEILRKIKKRLCDLHIVYLFLFYYYYYYYFIFFFFFGGGGWGLQGITVFLISTILCRGQVLTFFNRHCYTINSINFVKEKQEGLIPPCIKRWPLKPIKQLPTLLLFRHLLQVQRAAVLWTFLCFIVVFVCLIWFFTSTQQSFSYAGRVFLGWTSTKLG